MNHAENKRAEKERIEREKVKFETMQAKELADRNKNKVI